MSIKLDPEGADVLGGGDVVGCVDDVIWLTSEVVVTSAADEDTTDAVVVVAVTLSVVLSVTVDDRDKRELPTLSAARIFDFGMSWSMSSHPSSMGSRNLSSKSRKSDLQ